MAKDFENDSDVLIEEEEGIEEVTTQKFVCPNCGGGMEFSPNEQKLECPYCKSEIDIESKEIAIKEYSFDEVDNLIHHSWGGKEKVIKCSNCGGETVVDDSTAADYCVFCGSSHIVVSEGEDVGIKPETLIPFKITKIDAENKFKKWIKGKFFAPKELKSKQAINRLKGTYIPFFTYDSDTSTAYIAKRGTYYYTTHTKTVNGKTVTERRRHIRWKTVRGVYTEYFDDVLVNASKKVDANLMERLGDFKLKGLKPFKKEYIAGFTAEKYSKSLKEGWNGAKGSIDSDIYHGIRRQVGGDEFRLVNRSTNYGDVKFKHILLPVWMSSYTFKDKIYNYIVNGQTGKVSGEYPKSPGKIAAVVIGTAALIAVVVFILKSNNII